MNMYRAPSLSFAIPLTGPFVMLGLLVGGACSPSTNGGEEGPSTGGTPTGSGGQEASGGAATESAGGTESLGGQDATGTGGKAIGAGGNDQTGAGGAPTDECSRSTGQKAPRAARSFGFSGSDTDYAELYDAPCTVDDDCVAPCTARGGTEEFCGDSICIHSATDYCLPPTKWRAIDQVLTEGTTEDDAAVTSLSTANGAEHDRLIVEDFEFALPETAVILGITATIRRSGGAQEASDQRVRLVKAGAVSSVPREMPGSWPTTLTAASYGGFTDLWGESWTPSDINSPNFGLAISALPSGTSGRAYVDVVYLEVHYSICD